MRPEDATAYEVIEKREIKDIHSMSYLMRHKKTGARIALLENDDENKVFYIGFRTPPVDSAGSAHIVEHTVLCGSKEFPLKDPFIELAKGSLNTFLNAMTYPDKTVYPVASCNEKDFQNLMHVYLDAVFYPNIYREEKIFRQEGWHYEMKSQEEPLTINGVVYNEMKGAFSSPDDVLERQIMNALYPDTSYGFESGGDPDVIPTLTYEKFLDFHRRYYHPSNSYIYLYGNMNMAEKLQFLDEHYLSHFEEQPIDSTIAVQPPFDHIHEYRGTYPVSESESEKDNTYLSLTKSFGNNLDPELYLAFEVLDYCLCSAPGAPLRQTMIDRNIGKDVYSIYEEGIKQPYFSVIAKNANLDQKEEFLQTYQEVLTELVRTGLDHKALYAALNNFEFKYREADFGSYPKGLMYGLQMLDSWLHDDRKPFIHIEANATYAALRKKVESGYFEQLIKTCLLDNQHGSIVILTPEKGLTVKKEKQLEEKLEAYKNTLSRDEIAEIVKQTEKLKEYQGTPDTPQDLACIPHLTREDLKKEADMPVNELHTLQGTEVLFHPVVTNGIGYLRLLFDCSHVPQELFPYVGLFKNIVGLLDTEHYSYGDLFHEINLKTGGMTCVLSSYTNDIHPEKYRISVDIKTKVFYSQLQDAFALIQEILMTTKWNDPKRIRELLEEEQSRAQSEMLSGGHAVAVQRALSYQSESAAAGEILNGITQYRLMEKLVAEYDSCKEELIQKIQKLAEIIFRPENLMVDYTAEKEAYAALADEIVPFRATLYQTRCQMVQQQYHPEVIRRNEGFTSASQVQYVASVGNFRKHGLIYTGALKVLKMILGYDYLWNNVRVKGGAYGCMSRFARTGDCYLVSYRDPNLTETLDVYAKAADYIADFKNHPENEEKLTQYVIGAIGEIDTPKTPQSKGTYGLDCYLSGVSGERIQHEREELLEVTLQKISDLAPYLEAIAEDHCICTLGGEEKIEEASSAFMKIEALFQQGE